MVDRRPRGLQDRPPGSRTLLLTCLVLLCAPAALRGDSGTDLFVDAFSIMEKAEELERATELSSARAEYEQALAIFRRLGSDFPEWHPNIVEYRIRYLGDKIAGIDALLGVAAEDEIRGAAPDALRKLTERIRELNAELEKERRARREDAAALARAGEEISRLREEGAAERVAELVREAALMRDRARTAESALAATEARPDLSMQVMALRAEIDDLKTALAASRTREHALADQLDAARDQVSTLGRHLRDADAECQAAQTRAQDLEGRTEDLRRVIQDRDARVDRLEASVEALRSEFARAEKEVVNLRKDRDTRAEDLRRSREEMQRLRQGRIPSEQLEAVERRLRETLLRAEQLEQELEAERSAREASRIEIARLRREADEAARVADGLRAAAEATAEPGDAEKASRRIRELEAALGEERQRAREATQVHAALETRARDAEQRADRLSAASETTIRDLRGRVAQAEGRILELEERLAAELQATPAGDTRPPEAVRETAKPPLDPQLLRAADAAMEAGEAAEAQAVLERLLQACPANTDILRRLARVEVARGRQADALAHLEALLSGSPDDVGALVLAGYLSGAAGDFHDGAARLHRALALDPSDAQARIFLGVVLSSRGWYDTAETLLMEAAKLAPSSGEAHHNLAVLYSVRPEPSPSLAREHYRRARELNAPRDEQLEKWLEAQP